MGSNDDIRFLAGNPILISINTGVNTNGRYRIYTGEGYITLLHDGNVFSISGTAIIDLSELFTNLRFIAGVMPAKMVTVDSEGVEYIPDPVQNSTNYYEFTVYGGGISKLMQRKLVAATSNIFSQKLKLDSNNFFLTSRTNNRIITIPENELMPFFYYAKDMNFEIYSGNDLILGTEYSETYESLMSIDFAALRKYVFDNMDRLISVFDIYDTNNTFACRVVITHDISPTIYALKFRNSLGVLEMIRLQGIMSYKPEFTEVQVVESFDIDVNTFSAVQQRKLITNKFTAEVGYITSDERLFVIDAILSNECYLVVDIDEYAVNVKTDISLLQDSTGEPISIQLQLEMKDKDTIFTSIISTQEEILATNDGSPITVDNYKIHI